MECISQKECAEPLRLSLYPLWLSSNPEKSLPHLGQARPPSGEAVAEGLRRAREARGGYMHAVFAALLCQWPLLAIVSYWCAQVAPAALVWHTQFSEQAVLPMLALPRYKTVIELHHGRVPTAWRTTAGWPLDWPVGPLRSLAFSTGTLLADIQNSTCHSYHFPPSRVASNAKCAAHWWPLRSIHL